MIYFDAGDSVAVPFWVLQQYVETDATHVSILTGIGGVDEGVSCIKYALGKLSGVDLFALEWNGMECTHAGHG